MAVPPRLAVPAGLLWLVIAPTALWALARTAGLERGPLLVQLMAFTPYVAALSAIPLVVALLARNWWASAVAGLACLALVVAVVPRALGNPSTGTGTAARLTVMSVNLRVGGADAASIVDLVGSRTVDVLALQEFNPGAREALAAAGLTDVLPYAQMTDGDGATGSAIYSRLALTDGAVVHGYWFRQARATVHPGGHAVTVESVHPPPPVSRAGPGWVEALRAQTPGTAPGLRLLAGDFNATLDHAEMRRLLATGYRDAASAVGAGLRPTWSFYGPRAGVTPRVTIDHILVKASIGVASFDAVAVPRTDHRAIIATVYIGL